ncbi:coproporphyrinogen dehydrogenase HemZ [Thermanaerosceptrum fracticalcis]|uniref:Coproporphyrinogen dehydrogenase HemZ n=1 Tax=Thermanaerosceptrum fracticalcis TaxID=1712410 RepID=A0A7G6DZP4_THEFR|nr:coproporphyrinogen dehydrogenase HemZ [Thermanaerosceptrum fracticalcis]QNB45298.1 coproporphyrinogen dehydrogenase HemZ [Thermanaerosceptrum fracticalcis]
MMKRITVISQDPEDHRVLTDLLRIYFPRVMVGGGGLEEPDAFLYIERDKDEKFFLVTLSYEGNVCSHTEKISSPSLTGEDPLNHRKRTLRLAVHKLLTRNLDLTPSPWGILTGVRPTKIVHRLMDQDFAAGTIREILITEYGLSSNKAQLVTGIARLQRDFLLTKEEAKRFISIYVGIPFCPTRCHYCSFPAFSLKRWGHLLDPYLAGLEREIAGMGAFLKEHGFLVQTVYIGGGTPTLLTAEQLDQLLTCITENFNLIPAREFTVEGGRPDTIDDEKLGILKKHRITRLSINPQTMHPETLELIGRKHTTRQIADAFYLAKESGIPVINMDLIIGLPGENLDILRETLAQVMALKPENITLHALAVKRAAYYSQEGIELPHHHEDREMMELAQKTLSEAGYIPYYLYRQKEIFAQGENVGYALPGQVCLYNIQMMEERQTILGFGVGSGSKLVKVQDWTLENIYNPKDIEVYLNRLEAIIAQKVDKLTSFVYNNCHV